MCCGGGGYNVSLRNLIFFIVSSCAPDFNIGTIQSYGGNPLVVGGQV